VSALPVPDVPEGQGFGDRGHTRTNTHSGPAAVEPSAHLGHSAVDTHDPFVEVGTLADRAKHDAIPTECPPDQPPRDGQSRPVAHATNAVAATLSAHAGLAAHVANAGQGGDPSPPTDPNGYPRPMVVPGRAEDARQRDHPTVAPPPTPGSGDPADVILAICADLLDDLERVRIATENRVRSLGQVKGLDGTPEEARMVGIMDGIKALEHDAELQVQRAMRGHPLGQAVKAMKGVGDKQAGRLLAAIGDPYIHGVTGEPRTVSQLWAYCGYHVLRSGHRSSDDHKPTAGADSSRGGDAGQGPDGFQAWDAGVAPSRARGQRANWNADAKMRAHLVAKKCVLQLRKPCVKPEGQTWADHVEGCQCGAYRTTYDEGRRKYADAVHQVECRRCGPSGKPAQPGSPLSLGHQEARALRLVAKAVLRDLWIAAREVHEAAG
jgi:hypothetical protein